MIFIDTSAWYALSDAHDKDHLAVRKLFGRIGSGEFGKAVTTNYVQAEALTLVRTELGLGLAEKLATGFESTKELRTIWIEPVHHAEALQLMFQRKDKEWSVVDCTSFVVMRALQIEVALSLDSDFAQAGFSLAS